ncbi:MAG: phenylalanine--tRNA ligase subunit beta, partial [Syntrophaceae bacterium]
FIDRGEGEQPREADKLALLLTGSRYGENWHFQGLTADFYDLKGALENLASCLRLEDLRFASDATIPYLHPGRAARVLIGDREIGSLGEVHPDVIGRMDLRNRAFVLEIETEPLMGRADTAIRYREYSRFPAMIRDVAFLVPMDVDAGGMIGLVRETGEELLETVDVFDVYSGKGIPDGMKSLGLRFTYRSPSRTLTDDETGQVHGRIVKRIVESTGARIRGES